MYNWRYFTCQTYDLRPENDINMSVWANGEHGAGALTSAAKDFGLHRAS